MNQKEKEYCVVTAEILSSSMKSQTLKEEFFQRRIFTRIRWWESKRFLTGLETRWQRYHDTVFAKMLLSGGTISVRRCNQDTVNPTLIQSGAGDKYREADT